MEGKSVSYASIEPLVAGAEVRGERLTGAFRCPVSGATHRASAPLEEPEAARLGALSGALSAVGHALRGALGFGRAEAAAAADAAPGEPVDPGDHQDAVVRAFLKVSPPFLWDARSGRWVSTEGAGDLSTLYDQQLSRAPVREHGDRCILARMLTEVAKADGRVDTDEWAFLTGYILADIGSVDDFMEMPPLTDEDLRQASPGAVRETFLLIAWVLAFADRERGENEQPLVERFAAGLEVPPERREAMRRAAQRFVIDHAMREAYPGGQLDPAARDAVFAAAERIGLPRPEAEEVEARYRMRNAIV